MLSIYSFNNEMVIMLFNNVSYLVKKHIIHLNHSTYYHNYIYIHNSILSILSRREWIVSVNIVKNGLTLIWNQYSL